MNVALAVIGQGAVTPAGVGLDALLHREPVATPVAPLATPAQTWPVLRVDLQDPAFARWQREARLRRASPISFFLIEAADQALAGVSAADRAKTGLIVAYSAGCVAYSRRFFEGILQQGQKTASPALFPETVFNSPASHVAAVLGLNGAAYALVGDETAWVAALQTASVWLRQERVEQAVVLGVEEFDPLVLDAYRSARWLRRHDCATGFLASEGAAGILVRQARPDDACRITAARDGFIYRTKKQAQAAAENLLRASEALPIYRTAQRNWLGPLEAAMSANPAGVPTPNLPYLGEAFTASAAWHTIRALRHLGPALPRILLPIWGLNHQLASVELATGK